MSQTFNDSEASNATKHIATYDSTRQLYIVVIPIMLAACAVSFFLNVAILMSARWIRRTLSPTLFFSLSLALADAFASLILGIGLLMNSLLPVVYGVDLGRLHICYTLTLEAFRLAGLIATVLHLLALAVNHYIGIIRPLHYASTVTRKSTLLAVVLMWVLPILFFFIYFSSVPGEGFQSTRCGQLTFMTVKLFRIIVSLLFFLPLVLMTIMYIHIYFVVRQHQMGLLSYPSSRQFHKNVKAVVTTLLILVTYLLGWMPAVLFFVLTCLDCLVPYSTIPLQVRVLVLFLLNTLVVLKSLIDPFIYAARMPEVKDALKLMIKTRCGFSSWESRRTNGSLLSRTDTITSSIKMVSFKNRKNSVCSDKFLNSHWVSTPHPL